jgi:hypothetical protein
MKVTIDVAREKAGVQQPLVRFDAYENKSKRRLDQEIQHTISILLDEPDVTGIQITVEK